MTSSECVTSYVCKINLIELLEVCVVDVFEDESRSSGDRILDDPLQGDDVGAAAKVLQDLDLALDLLLLDWKK